jgi:hypothetical protein
MRVGQQWSENNFEELNHLSLHLTLEHIGKNLATYFFQFNFKYKIFKNFSLEEAKPIQFYSEIPQYDLVTIFFRFHNFKPNEIQEQNFKLIDSSYVILRQVLVKLSS